MATQQKTVQEIRDYFREHYGYIDMFSLEDSVISEFMVRPYITPLSFEMQMDCLKDYIMANDLTHIEE
jgi:hypothetical protein